MNQIKMIGLVVVVLLYALTSAVGGELFVGSDGSIRIGPSQVKYTATAVAVTKDAAKYPTAVAKAYGTPGVPVAVSWGRLKLVKLDLFSLSGIRLATAAVLYNKQQHTISVVGTSEVQKDTAPDIFLMFLGIAVLAMFFSMVTREKTKFIAVAAFASFIAGFSGAVGGSLAIIFSTYDNTAISVFLIALAVISALGTFLFIISWIDELNKRYYTIVYSLLVVSIGLYLIAF